MSALVDTIVARATAWVWPCCAAAVICLASTGQARAACPPGDEVAAILDDAIAAYVGRDFDTVASLLGPLLEGEPCLEEVDDRVVAHLLFGTALFQQGELGLAEVEFVRVFQLEPEFDVDDAELPNKATRAFLEKVRTENADLIDSPDDTVGFDTYYVTVETQRNQLWINFVPFGAGQFQAEAPAWGWTYLSVESAALALSLTGAIAVEVLRGDSFAFSADEAEAARSWQVVQLASAGVFLGAYAVGVVHALLIYEPNVTVGFSPPSKTPPGDGDGVSWRVAPQLGPQGGGLTVGVTF